MLGETPTRLLNSRELSSAFRAALIARLDSSWDISAGASAERLAREFRDGLAGLICALEHERKEHEFNPHGLLSFLMEVWTRGDDDRDLAAATGMTREQWLKIAS